MWVGLFRSLAFGGVISLATLACAVESAEKGGGAEAQVAAPPEAPQPLSESSAAAAGALPVASEEAVSSSGGGGGLEADAGPLGLLGPVFPGLGGSSHSARCDPFEDSSEVCL